MHFLIHNYEFKTQKNITNKFIYIFVVFFSCFHNYVSKKCIIIYNINNIFVFFSCFIIMYLN